MVCQLERPRKGKIILLSFTENQNDYAQQNSMHFQCSGINIKNFV